MVCMRFVIGLMFVILLAAAFADNGIFPTDNLNESSVVVTPASDGSTVLNLSVLTYAPAVSTGGTNVRQVMTDIINQCKTDPNPQSCIQTKALALTASSTSYKMNVSYVQGAN